MARHQQTPGSAVGLGDGSRREGAHRGSSARFCRKIRPRRGVSFADTPSVWPLLPVLDHACTHLDTAERRPSEEGRALILVGDTDADLPKRQSGVPFVNQARTLMEQRKEAL
jgi:hypothetical protein